MRALPQARPFRPLPWRLSSPVTALVVVVLLAVTACSSSDDSQAASLDSTGLASSAAGPGSDTAAPDFAVPTLDDSVFRLSEHLTDDGRPVFLNLWATWCPPCREEMPAIDESAAGHPGIKFIGVAISDNATAAAEFVDEIAIDYTIGIDESREVEDGYAPVGLPASYIISSDGVILERIFGTVDTDMLAAKLQGWFGS